MLRFLCLGSRFLWDGMLHDQGHALIIAFELLVEAQYTDLLSD